MDREKCAGCPFLDKANYGCNWKPGQSIYCRKFEIELK